MKKIKSIANVRRKNRAVAWYIGFREMIESSAEKTEEIDKIKKQFWPFAKFLILLKQLMKEQ